MCEAVYIDVAVAAFSKQFDTWIAILGEKLLAFGATNLRFCDADTFCAICRDTGSRDLVVD